jgi:hypothetical protein
MSEVFISYARTTKAYAKRVADALRACGFSVWYDEDLPAHRAFSEVIEERLREAKAVVVVWSAEAVNCNGCALKRTRRARLGRSSNSKSTGANCLFRSAKFSASI